MSFQASIIKAIGKLEELAPNPDSKHNTGRSMGEYLFWTTIMQYADKQRDATLETMQKEGMIPTKKELDPGDHHLLDSPTFTMLAKVTQPIRRFDTDEMARLLKASKYKVPEPVTKELAERAKLGTTSMVTFKVLEKS